MKKILQLDLKYSAIQALFYGSYCALLGYASVYLLSKGFSNSLIGIVLASVSAIAVFAQPMIGSFADKNKKIELRKIVCFIIAIAVALSFMIYFLGNKSIILICVFVGIATCMMTITPLINSMAFLFEKHGIELNFGLARGIGSAAYALVSFALGYLVEDFSASIIPLVYLVFNILLIIVVYSFVIPRNMRQDIVEEVEVTKQEQASFFQFVMKYKRFSVFVLGTVLVFFTHTIINNFFIQILREINGTESQMGTAVFLAAILELPAMSFFNQLRSKISISTLIKISVILFAVKHALTFFAPNITVIYIAQVFQMGAYAIFTPASVYYVNEIVSKNDLVKGQSMLTMAQTASGIIANLVGGVLLDAVGVSHVLLIGIAISVVGALVVMGATEKTA